MANTGNKDLSINCDIWNFLDPYFILFFLFTIQINKIIIIIIIIIIYLIKNNKSNKKNKIFRKIDWVDFDTWQ